jgi:luciferase family oxidoreductase group 1
VRPVSILDLSPVPAGASGAQALRNTLDLARLADRLGFHRYWLAEHHGGSMLASSSPEIVIGHVADATERIRVGSGGVMLPNHSPLRVAEQFKVLEALHPGRIDLGIGRAPGTDQLTALALRRDREALAADDFPEQLAELMAFAGSRPWPAGHPFAHVDAAPADAPLPPIFLLGSSDFSAQLAAAAGFGFAFAAHINPRPAVEVLRLYRQRFQPSAELAEPWAILAHNVICAPDDELARRLAAPARVAYRRLRGGRPGPIPSLEEALAEDRPFDPARATDPTSRLIAGDPDTVRGVLEGLLEASGADELMLSGYTHAHEDRRRSYELIAEAFGLAGEYLDEPRRAGGSR